MTQQWKRVGVGGRMLLHLQPLPIRPVLTLSTQQDRVDVETILDRQVDVETSSLRKATVETRPESGAPWKPVGHRATVETGSQLAGFGPRGSQPP